MSTSVQEQQQQQQQQQQFNEMDDARSSIFFDDDEDSSQPQPSAEFISFAATIAESEDGFDKRSIARLVSQYGSASSTAWLEFSRYKIWQAPESFLKENPTAQFLPVQGYMQHKKWIFAWGNPLVSDVSLLSPTAKAFVNWAINEQKCKPVWCCTDLALETVLGKEIGWSAVGCIQEEVLEPEHILEMTGDGYRGKEGVHAVKDLKKNLRRAERAGVTIEETTGKWTPKDRKEVEEGLWEWKKGKAAKGVQIASTTGQPWIDEPHRRYLVARHEGHIVGILILTPIHGPYKPAPVKAAAEPVTATATQKRRFNLASLNFNKKEKAATPAAPAASTSSDSDSSNAPSPTFSRVSSSSSLSDDFSLDGPPKATLTSHYYLIKNAISFPVAPRGTSELLIHSSLELLNQVASSTGKRAPKVTFGITASDNLTPIDNLSGWKITGLAKVYGKVAKTAGLLKRGDFRAKFDSGVEPMYVCYPKEEGFGLDGIKSLLKVLRK
ncbi:hypothetical protein V5O48_015347 [Marasmius crinis-equi]|uniref:Phosphatidylglycerol lysyltransferase C-terminal domain-containing protein n=1 Tax=Marasmius crinis-equi TaxID=585013 RepID=A0ABR3EUS9_9AGAR